MEICTDDRNRVAGTCEHGNEIYISTEGRQHLDKRAASRKDYPTYNLTITYTRVVPKVMSNNFL